MKNKDDHSNFRADGLDSPLSPNGPHGAPMVTCDGCAGKFAPEALTKYGDITACTDCAEWAKQEAKRP